MRVMAELLAILLGVVVGIATVIDVWPRATVGIALFTGAFFAVFCGFLSLYPLRALLRILEAMSRWGLALRSPERFAAGDEDDDDEPERHGLDRFVAPEVRALVAWGAAGALGSAVASFLMVLLGLYVARFVGAQALGEREAIALCFVLAVTPLLPALSVALAAALESRRLAIRLTPPPREPWDGRRAFDPLAQKVAIAEHPLVFLGYVGLVAGSIAPVSALAALLPVIVLTLRGAR